MYFCIQLRTIHLETDLMLRCVYGAISFLYRQDVLLRPHAYLLLRFTPPPLRPRSASYAHLTHFFSLITHSLCTITQRVERLLILFTSLTNSP